jgi:hypothetical protein
LVEGGGEAGPWGGGAEVAATTGRDYGWEAAAPIGTGLRLGGVNGGQVDT